MRTTGASTQPPIPYLGPRGKNRTPKNRRRVLARRQRHIARAILCSVGEAERGGTEKIRRLAA